MMKHISRRQFVKNAQSIAVGSVLVSSDFWLSNAARADAGLATKKLICVYFPQGYNNFNTWFPQGESTENNFTLPKESDPLTSVKDHCIFLKGIHNPSVGHGKTSGTFRDKHYGSTPSLDQFVASTVGAQATYTSLQLGIAATGNKVSWNTNGASDYQNNPMIEFDRLFSGSVPTSNSLAYRQKKSVLDASLTQLAALESRIGSYANQRLEEHANSIRTVEKRLLQQQFSSQSTSGCSQPIWNIQGFSKDIASQCLELQMDLAILALSCNLTQVVTIQLGDDQDLFTMKGEEGITGACHASAHYLGIEAYRRLFSKKLAYLISGLAAKTDSDGNRLLDNTLVIQSSDFASGSNKNQGDGGQHSTINVPVVLAGAKNMGLVTGRYLQLPYANDVNSNIPLLNAISDIIGCPNPQKYGTTSGDSIKQQLLNV